MPAEGEWRLWYPSYRWYPGADFTFGTFRTGCYLTAPYEISLGSRDNGDMVLPRGDGIRFGRDYRAAATITFELAVDGVGASSTRHGRHAAGLSRLSAFARAWDAESLRVRYGHSAVLATTQGGRQRRFYGRPRKWAAAGSRMTRQGLTPVVAEFQLVDDTAYDDVEQMERVPLVWANAAPPSWFGPRLSAPIGGGFPKPPPIGPVTPNDPPGVVYVRGNKPSWPFITIHGPISKPAVVLEGWWTATFDLTLKRGEKILIETRPWISTVTRGGASVAGLMRRGSPRLDEMVLPPGRQVFRLKHSGLPDPTAYMTIQWRDAFAHI
ncbi:hypothetical protein ACIQ9R_36405 [Streptomyces sp. NPDC094447]|uniref:hypothetical protein n=1 Tax=Streptomyces sp. NPDC094447 TaxID=3366062 RepID=UPI0038028106